MLLRCDICSTKILVFVKRWIGFTSSKISVQIEFLQNIAAGGEFPVRDY